MSEVREAAATVARRSYGKLVAYLASRTRDVALAEDALSEAFAAALAAWPKQGCPENPEAWLLTVARRKVIDAARRQATRDRMMAQLETADVEAAIPDRRLALMFACAHPAIEAEVRAPLMLQVILGLNAATIAGAFVVSPAAMAKRLVRAKTKIREAGIPLRVPERDELAPRLDAVLAAIYAAFAEAWTEPGGSRAELNGEALFLARLVVELLPDEPEALGLLALLLHAEARRRARRTSEDEYVPFAAQDTSLWDWTMIAEAEHLLRRACEFRSIGRYQLEGALQSAHVARCRTGRPDWVAVVSLYDVLLAMTNSPVVALNRALAVAELSGVSAALAAIAGLAERLADYQPYWAARADLLARAGASAESRRAYDLAIGLTQDAAVRRFLQRRQSELA